MPSTEADVTNSGQWLVVHPDEWIVTFFLPLVEPLRLHPGILLRSLISPSIPAIHLLGSSRFGFMLAKLGDSTVVEYQPPSNHRKGAADEEEMLGTNWTNKFFMSSSIITHRLTGNFFARSSLDVAFALCRTATGEQRPIDHFTSTAQSILPDISLVGFETSQLHEMGQVTVFECAVGTRLLGQPIFEPSLDPIPLEDTYQPPDYPQESDVVLPGDLTMWTWREAQEDRRIPEAVISRRIQNALEIAIQDCRSILRAYHGVTRAPVTMLTRERLPPMVPFLLRRHATIGQIDPKIRPGLVMTSNNAWGYLLQETLTAEDERKLNLARGQLHAPFTAHLDFHREADVALRRHGDTRATAIFTAVAAESLLDELLLHLMWEEQRTPEDIATEWIDGLISRVKREYPSRLGGNWDLTARNPIGGWSRNVADLRHRVVHGTYGPTVEEARVSMTSVNDLVTYLSDRLADPQVSSRYPRTAIALLGEPGMTRRGVHSRRITQLRQSESEPEWSATFHRWFQCWRRVRRDQTGAPRTPDKSRAYLLSLIDPNGSLHWCLHDRETYLALEVGVDRQKLDPTTNSQIDRFIKHVQDTQVGDRISIAFEAPVPSFAVGTEWVEEYHLVPLAGVMVDRSDYDR